MTAGEWGAVIGILVTIGSVGLLALDERMRRKFAARDDLNALGKKVDANQTLFVQLDDRVGAVETEMQVMQERTTQQWERISERVEEAARTMDSVTLRLERMAEKQEQQAIRLERLQPRRGVDS